jgi:hypothetical protein
MSLSEASMAHGDENEARRLATRMVLLITPPMLRRQLEQLPRHEWSPQLAARAEEIQETIAYVTMLLAPAIRRAGFGRAFSRLLDLCVRDGHALPDWDEIARLKEHFLPSGAFHQSVVAEQMLDFLLEWRRVRGK